MTGALTTIFALIGLIVSIVCAVAGVAIFIGWAVDHYLRTANLMKEFTEWYVEKLKKRKGNIPG